MSPSDLAKQRIKRNLYWAVGLLVVCTVPFVFCALKSAYANQVPILSNLAAGIYRSSSHVQSLWKWSIFPPFLPKAGVSVGNVFAALFAGGFLFGVLALQSAWSQFLRYDRLKHEADDNDLRDDFRG